MGALKRYQDTLVFWLRGVLQRHFHWVRVMRSDACGDRVLAHHQLVVYCIPEGLRSRGGRAAGNRFVGSTPSFVGGPLLFMTNFTEKKNEMISGSLRIAPIGENQSLKTRAYEALKASILAMNIYDEDAQLKLDERELSAQFGISRTPLREALAQLDQEGIVKVVSRRGIFIVRKTKSEILDMITVWAALEAMAARLATSVASDTELAGLHSLVDEYKQDEIALRMGEYSDSNIAFHSAILKLGKCPLLESTADGLLRHVRAIRNRTIFEKDRATRSIEDHRAIVDALVSRDADTAERLVRDHTFRLREHVAMFVNIS